MTLRVWMKKKGLSYEEKKQTGVKKNIPHVFFFLSKCLTEALRNLSKWDTRFYYY